MRMVAVTTCVVSSSQSSLRRNPAPSVAGRRLTSRARCRSAGARLRSARSIPLVHAAGTSGIEADGGEEDARRQLISQIKEIKQKKQALAAEAVRLKMSGQLTPEDDELLKDALGNAHQELIPPENVLRMMRAAGIPPPNDRDGGAIARSFGDGEELQWDRLQREVKLWQRNLERYGSEDLDIAELARIAAGSGDRYAGELRIKSVPLQDAADMELDEDTVYDLTGATLEDLKAMGLPDLSGPDPMKSAPEHFRRGEDLKAMAGSSMVPIGAEEGWEDNADVQEESVINRDAVEAYLARLEAGEPIVLDDRPGDLPREDAGAFKRRLQQLKDHYEDQFRKPRERKLSPEEARQLEAEFQDLKDKTGATFDGTSKMPVDTSWDSDVRRLAPASPPDVQERMNRFLWVKFLLRRAHMSTDPLEPGKQLLDAGLLSQDCSFGDPKMVLKGAARWLAMLDCLSSSGAYSQIASVFGVQTKDDPPRYYVVVDHFLHLRVPAGMLVEKQDPRVLWVDREREVDDEVSIVDDNVLEDCLKEWRKQGIGCDWETDPSVCTVCVTTKYDISCSEGKVELVNSCWGMIAGSIPADRFDELYSTCCGGISEVEIWHGGVEYLYHNPKRK